MTYSHIYIIDTGKVTKECQKIASDFFKQEVIFVKILKIALLLVQIILIFSKKNVCKIIPL